MTADQALRPEDVYDAATIAGFRSAGYWRDDTLSASVDRLAAEQPDRVLVTDGYGALTTTELREQAYRLAGALRAGQQAGVFELRAPAGDVASFLFALADGVTIRRLCEPARDVKPLMDQAVAAARALLA